MATVKPTVNQLKLLRFIEGGKLVLTNSPDLRVLDREGKDHSWRFRLITAQKIVEREWVGLRHFGDASEYGYGRIEGEYQLATYGLALLMDLCTGHKHDEHDNSTEIVAHALVCNRCGRCVPCASRKKAAHPANRWHWKYGPMCNWCWRQVFRTP